MREVEKGVPIMEQENSWVPACFALGLQNCKAQVASQVSVTVF